MNKLRTLLVVPPFPERTYPGKSMALDYLATALLSENAEVRILDLDVETTKAFVPELVAFQPELIGITNMSLQNDWGNCLAQKAKTILPSAVVVKGGVHETFSYGYTMELHHDYVDACVVGEGEETIRDIASAVRRGTLHQDIPHIKGIAYWNGAEACYTGTRGILAVDRCLPTRLTFHDSYNFDVFDGRKTAQVMTARGCSNSCLYCSESVLYDHRAERYRSLSGVAEELHQLKELGYEAVYFDDSTFTRNPNRVVELCEILKSLDLAWGCNTRVDALDEELISRMRESGCAYLFCGVETAVPEILLGMNKTRHPSLYLDRTRNVYEWLRRSGIPSNVFLIFGGPRLDQLGENVEYSPERPEDAQQSLEFAIFDLDPDYLSMNVLRLLPGLRLSIAAPYAQMRPTGHEPVHGGHYDIAWYQREGQPDMRSTHPIYRAFEGCGSVHPPSMNPKRCYDLLQLAVQLVNCKNADNCATQTRIVVDRRFQRYLFGRKSGGAIQYELSSFEKIGKDALSKAPKLEWD